MLYMPQRRQEDMMEASNMKAMHEALKTIFNLAYEVRDANSECGPKQVFLYSF